jgi:hypothetical protein
MFFLIWRGWGILVPIITGVALVLGFGLGQVLLGTQRAETYAAVITAIAFLAAAVTLWKLGRRVNAHAVQTLLDPATGQTVTIRRLHTLFFVRMEYWAVPLALLSGLGLVAQFAA